MDALNLQSLRAGSRCARKVSQRRRKADARE